MAANPETLAAMKQLIVLADKLGRLQAKVVPAHDKNEKSMRAAIAGKKRHLIQTYLAVAAAIVDQITPSMGDLNLAKVALHKVSEDEQFVAAKVAEIEKLSAKLDDAEAALTGTFQASKRLQNEGEKGLEAALKAEKFEVQELAQTDNSIKEFRKEAKTVLMKSEAINTKASNAADARNAKALAAAQAEMKALDVDAIATMHGFWTKRVDELAKKAKEPALAPDIAADLADGANDLRSELAGAAVAVEYSGKNRDRVMGLAVTEIDLKKALKVLELDAKFEAKLKKALDGPAGARVKALEAIGKEAKQDKPDGKAMETALVKAKVIEA